MVSYCPNICGGNSFHTVGPEIEKVLEAKVPILTAEKVDVSAPSADQIIIINDGMNSNSHILYQDIV